MPVAPGRLHHSIRRVAGAEKKVAHFVRHDEPQQHARVAMMLFGGRLDRLEVGIRHIPAGVFHERLTHHIEGCRADSLRMGTNACNSLFRL